jgi:histidinol dehydrogenase
MEFRMINFFDLSVMSRAEIDQLMQRAEFDIATNKQAVSAIIDKVRQSGDTALLDYTREFDGVSLPPSGIAVSAAEMQDAIAGLDPAIKDVIDKSARNIRKFHESQVPGELTFTMIDDGIYAGERITPIRSIGLYVPRGKGAFPSVMLMLGIPASIAKVPRIQVCTPPTPDGGLDATTLYAASLCGITNIYKVGGAQAIAAMAYGTQSIPKVDKVLGPGNTYVSAAKRLLYGVIDVGTPAGPSESIILCDEAADPRIAALDLLIEAEHGPDSSAFLVTHSRALAEAAIGHLPELIADLPQPRRQFCETVLSKYGGVVLTRDLNESVGFVNDYAPEHLELLVDEPVHLLQKILYAGEILLGANTPITFGNYCLGVNAILPTGGFARTHSSVTLFDYLKRTSIGYVSAEGYRTLAPTAQLFAQSEGFPSHANAISKR